jgi:biopolymer transport protein ExbB
VLALPSVAHAWWNDDWKFRKELTFDTTAAGANITGSQSDVPVLVRLHAGNFGYFADAKPDGSDLRFVANDDKTPLKFHVEKFDATNQLAFVWLKLPKLAGGAATDKVFLYYGNPKAPAAGDAGGTYDLSQLAVFHFADDKAAVTDATAYANNPKTNAADALPGGLIGVAAHFDKGKTIVVAPSSSLKLEQKNGATLSAWVQIDAAQTDAYLIAVEDGPKSLVLGVNNRQVFARAAGVPTPGTAQSADVLAFGEWHHVAVTENAGKLIVLVDAQEVASAQVDIGEIGGSLTLGAGADGSHAFVGNLDEVQVAKTARNADWLQTLVKTQGAQASLIVYGNDAQKESGGGTSYFRVTLQNVTPDGWVVIGILAVMFVIALMIIVTKAMSLSSVAGANRAFLKEFERVKDDLAAHVEDDKNRYRLSTLFRLYQHGVQEMRGRVAKGTVGAAAVSTLTPQAIASMRAAMDGTLVRQTQKLQSQMVLLTIAISGGPFLGLLGTVVGVMITFAAIAASGDVNVNSIAPGIAAALAATVAGLAVAIPALFGYNWLNTKIKEIHADQQVFVDEFVTRVAEHYS